MRDFNQSVRRLNGLTLYFHNKCEVLAWDKRGSYIIVRRMDGARRGYYKYCWKPFIEKLYRNNSLSSVIQVARLANEHDLDVFCPSYQSPPPVPDDILVRPSKFEGGKAMGIFKPTDTSKYNVIVYSKWCIECEEPGYMTTLTQWAMHNNLELKVIRTSYKPADHKRAADIFGSEDYPAFVVYNDVITLVEFVKMIRDTKNKMIKPAKKKGGRSDLQRLSKAKEPQRKDSVAVQADETKNENKE